MDKPLLSIIITSYDVGRLQDVFELFDSIVNQTCPNIETIFVAERSRLLYERAKYYVEKRQQSNIRVIYNSGKPGLCEARNIGLDQAKGEFLAFVDDDVVLPSEWAQETVRTFLDPAVIGVTGPALPLWLDLPPDWLPEELHWVISCTTWFHHDGIIPVRNAWGHNMAFRRQAFELCGSFPTDSGYYRGLMGEDVAFSMTVRAKTSKLIVYNSKIPVLHKVPPSRYSWKPISRRSQWIGHSRRTMGKIEDELHETTPGPESALMRQMVRNLPIKILKTTLRRPRNGLRAVSVVLIVLASVTFGYLLPASKWET